MIGELLVSKADSLRIAGMVVTNDGTKTTFLGKSGDYNRIGDAGTTGHTLNSEDDLLITGDSEVDGTAYFDGNIDGASGQSVGFMGATPTAQAAHIADATGDDATEVNAILVVLENLGLVAAS